MIRKYPSRMVFDPKEDVWVPLDDHWEELQLLETEAGFLWCFRGEVLPEESWRMYNFIDSVDDMLTLVDPG